MTNTMGFVCKAYLNPDQYLRFLLSGELPKGRLLCIVCILDEVTRKTIKLASVMGVDRVVMMSGCPGAPAARRSRPNDRFLEELGILRPVRPR